MRITRNGLVVGMTDLGWRLGSTNLHSSLFFHETEIFNASRVSAGCVLDTRRLPVLWSFFEVAFLPDKEHPQVTRALLDVPMVEFWLLPTPDSVRRLLDRLAPPARG